jgi:transglutaminase-like putative cysteine protease
LKTFDIHCELGYEIGGPSTFLLNVEAASTPGQRVLHESLVTDPPLACDRYTDPVVKNRFVRFNADVGPLRVNYRATVEVDGAPEGVPDAAEVPVGELPLDVLRFVMPSRYCESDALMRMAVLEFGALAQGAQRVEAICAWIRDHVKYEIGTTQATHSAFDTVSGRAGVCRDFAHLAIAFCRALNIPGPLRHGLCDFRRSAS